MGDDSAVLRLAGALLIGLVGAAGLVIAGGWVLGRLHSIQGRGQPAPEAGNVGPEQRHVTPPAR